MQKKGITIVAAGDHNIHHFSFDRDVVFLLDEHSNVEELHISEADMNDLYWWIVETLPKLRKDRR